MRSMALLIFLALSSPAASAAPDDVYYGCLVKQAVKLGVHCFDTNDVVRAAMAGCQNERRDWVLSMSGSVRKLMESRQTHEFKDRLIREILLTRIQFNVSCPTQPLTKR